MTKRLYLNWGKKALLICCSLFVMLFATTTLRSEDIDADPQVTIPPPAAMPSPNARDFYIEAGNALVPLQVNTKQGMHSLGINEIAWMIGKGQLPGTGTGIAAYYTQPHKHAAEPVPSAKELQKLLSDNAPAMAMLRQGFRYAYREIPTRSFRTLFPYFAKYRQMVNCLRIDAYVKQKQGDWNGAMNDFLDGLYFGEQIPRGAGLIGGLFGMSLQAISRLQAWPTIDHLNISQAHAAAQRMEDIIRQHTLFADTLQEEKWMLQASWLEIMHRQPNWREFVRQSLPIIAETPQFISATPQFIVGTPRQSGTADLADTISKKQIMNELTGYFDAMIEDARLPYPLRKNPPLPKDPLIEPLLETEPKAQIRETYCETQNCLLLVSLALRAYSLEHGQYPDSLTALAPSYLTALPADPFAANGTLHYYRTEESYVLYSIGPDGKDDHGTPCAGGRKGKKGETFQAVEETSGGDIVAGVNVQ